MKKFHIFLSLLLFSVSIIGQPITLNSSAITNVVGSDSFAVVTNLASFSSFAATGSNMTWDASTALYNPSKFWYQRTIPSNAAFPTATYSNGISYLFSSSLKYNTQSYKISDANSLRLIGEAILTRQPISIGAATGNNNDSLVFGVQTILYSAPIPAIQFPATMNSVWGGAASFKTTFNLTVTAFGLNNTPGERRTIHTEIDSVVGWGKMRVKNFYGATTGYMNVLQVRMKYTALDSFFLGGAPAPAALLTAFGLTQGQVTTTWRVYFYRSGDITPLMYMHYSTPFTGTPNVVETSQDRHSVNGIAANEIMDDDLRLYPNPVQGKTLNIDLPQNKNGTWNYTVLNNLGQKITGGIMDINASQTKGIIELPHDIAPGIYSLQLICDGVALGVKQIMVAD